jgi:hypothetical protein
MIKSWEEIMTNWEERIWRLIDIILKFIFVFKSEIT